MILHDAKLEAYAEKFHAINEQIDAYAKDYCNGKIDFATNAKVQKPLWDELHCVWRNARAYMKRHDIKPDEVRGYFI